MYNIDVRVKWAYSIVQEELGVQERLWESEEGASYYHVESRSFESGVELVYYEECNPYQQRHHEKYSQVLRELDFWSDCIASTLVLEEELGVHHACSTHDRYHSNSIGCSHSLERMNVKQDFM